MSTQEVAVIGMSGIFPGANSIQEFLKNSVHKKDCITKPSDERIKLSGQRLDRNFAELGYINNIDKFDYEFFGLSYREAMLMDPQQRLALQEACKTIWDSGYSLEQFRGTNTGVILGCGNSGYQELIQNVDGVSKIGNMSAVVAGRISYQLDLKGLSYVVDTSCSSSLLAIHDACMHLANKDCDTVLAGGVQIGVKLFEIEEGKEDPLGIAAAGARTRAFSSDAEGTGGGEGCAFVLLKRVEDAKRDNDHIYAVIKATSANHDAASSNSLAAPSPTAQTEVILKAWEKADINPETIEYIETHGTGTKIGDPIEVKGLSDAFHKYTDKKGFCEISAVKTNIGHTAQNAGVSSFIRAVLAIDKKCKFPLCHYKEPNPMINFESSPVVPCLEYKPWTSKVRRAAVSSFGLSGTNVHIVLEQAPESNNECKEEKKVYPFLVTAQEESELEKLSVKLADYIENTEEDLQSICYTQCMCRDSYKAKRFILANTREDLKSRLQKECTSIGFEQERKPVLLVSDDTVFEDSDLQKLLQNPICPEDVKSICTPLIEENSQAVRNVIGHVLTFHILKMLGLGAKIVIGCGCGNIAVQYILNKISLESAIEKAKGYESTNELNKDGFLNAIRKMDIQYTLFIELGKQGILSSVIQENIENPCMICLDLEQGDMNSFGEAIVNLGVVPDWTVYFEGKESSRVSMPYASFKEESCWVEVIPQSDEKSNNVSKKSESKPVVSDVKEMIRIVWKEILGTDRFKDDDDFFEIGGNSLMTVQIVNRVKEYTGVELEADDIYTFNTVAKIADYIKEQKKTVEVREENTETEQEQEVSNLSYYQESMLVLYKQNPMSSAYNMPAIIKLTGELKPEYLFEAMQYVIERHEILRTIYKDEDGKFMPFVLDTAKLPCVIEDMSEKSEDEIQQKIMQDMKNVVFDLTKDIPLAMKLVKASEELHYVCIQIHHIAADGWSIGILSKELSDNYQKLLHNEPVTVEKLKMSYMDYAKKNNNFLAGEFGKKKLDYWLTKLNGIPECLDFPVDKRRPSVMMNYGSSMSFEFSNELNESINEFCKKNGLTPYHFLFAIYSMLLYRYSGQEDFCIGSPVANRKGLKEESIIGFFANTLAVRIHVDGKMSCLDYLSKCKSELTKDLRNQEIPFELVVKNLDVKRDASHSPIFQHGFVLQNINNEFVLDGVTAEFMEIETQYSKFELLLSITQRADTYTGHIEYSTELFKEETIDSLIKHYEVLLQNVIETPEVSVDQISMLTEEENAMVGGYQETTAEDFDF